MTVQEVISIIKSIRKEYEKKKFGVEALDVSIQALEEVEQYRAIAEVIEDFDNAERETLALALEELKKYRALGTVEELKEARKKQVAKKPIHDDGVWSICPCCGEKVANDSYEAVNGEVSYCEKCGQAMDWKEGWEDD